MKVNNQIFQNNFPEDKMTESVKLANYRGSAHQGHLQHFQKYAGGGGNQDNNDQMEDRQDKSTPRDGIDIVGNTRQIKTEYSQVSQIESGFHKSKTNQAEMLKELRSQYDHLKNLPLGREEERDPSSNSDSRQEGTSQVASSIPTSKHRQRKRQMERDRDYGQRQQRIWIVEKKQYQSIVANCQQKIQELLHAEMGYKRTIHELRSSMVSPKSTNDNKAERQMIKQLQNNLREEKQKNKYLQAEMEKSKNFSRQQAEKSARLESEFSSKTRQIYQYEDDKRKLEDTVRLEREKFQNSEIEKRKYQMQFEILRKDKDLQINRLMRIMDHEKIVAEMNLKSEIKKYQEEIELKDHRYRLLLEEYEKLKRESHEKKDKKDSHGAFQMFDDIKKLIQQNRNTQNEEFTKTINILISKMEQENEDAQSSNNFDLENERLKAEIKILKNQIEHLANIQKDDTEIENLKRFYQSEILAMKDVINLLETKLKQKQKIEIPIIPPSPKNYEVQDSGVLKSRIAELERALAQSQLIASENEKTYLMYKEKWERDENQLRGLKRRVDQVTFELEKCSKQYQFQRNMMRTENQTTLRIIRSDLDKANINVAYWQKQFENIKRFYEAKIEEKNRIIEESSNTASVEEIKKQYDRNFQIARAEYQRQIANLTQKVSNHPSYSVEYEELRKKHSQLQLVYFDLKSNCRKSWQLNQGIDHLWGIKQTEYGNVHEILRQVKNRPLVNYTSTYQSHGNVRQNDVIVREIPDRQSTQIVHEQPRLIVQESSSGNIANRQSAYEPPVQMSRQSGYGFRQSGFGVRQSGYGARQSGYAIRQSGPIGFKSGYEVRESNYGLGYPEGIRMSSAYDGPIDYNGDGYAAQRPGEYIREPGYQNIINSDNQGFYMPHQDPRVSEGFKIRQSSGYGDDYMADYGARRSRPYEPMPAGYDMSYDMRQSQPYNIRQSGAYQRPPPNFIEDPRISSASYHHGPRQSGFQPVMLMDSRSPSVYQSYRGEVPMVRV